jgi:hypothetical protein
MIEVWLEAERASAGTRVGFRAETGERDPIRAQFSIEPPFEPSELAMSEAMLLATLALAMQRRRPLRLHGQVSRTLWHTIDLYQRICANWWPHRYKPIPVEVEVVDDRPPISVRSVLSFSGGLDSIYSARALGAAGLVDAALLVGGYDIDAGPGRQQQRLRVARLLERLGLPMIFIDTNVRQVLGQKVIEGAQGSYLAAALTLLSDSFGRGYVSSGVVDLGDLGVSDPVHEVTMPLLGSTRFPLLVYGAHASRLEKLAEVAAEPGLFHDLRVCLERSDDGHCGCCPKCVLTGLACVAVTGRWPEFYPESAFQSAHLTSMRPSETRYRLASQILQHTAENGREGRWRAALAAWLGSPYPAAGWVPSKSDDAIVPRAVDRLEVMAATGGADRLAGKDAGVDL